MKRIQGYTLVELIVVIVLVGILSSAIGIMLKEGFDSYQAAKPIIAVAGKANAAMDVLMRELEGAISVTGGNTSSITFLNQAGNTIVYNLSGSNLQRTENSGTPRILCTEVSTFTFTYFDSALASLTAPVAIPSLIRFISLNITVDKNNTAPYSLMGSTALRRNSYHEASTGFFNISCSGYYRHFCPCKWLFSFNAYSLKSRID